MGKLAGINFHGINPMIKVCTGKLLWCLTLKILKECHYTKLMYINKYLKTFAVLLKTVKSAKV